MFDTPTKASRKPPNGNTHGGHDDRSTNESELEPSGSEREELVIDGLIEELTPIKRGRGRPKGSLNKSKENQPQVTPRKALLGKTLFQTPTKSNSRPVENGTPSIARNADRSARRKSARTLIERTVTDNISDDEDEDDLARDIYDDAERNEHEETDVTGYDIDTLEVVPETPSKRGRGRPKGSKNKRSPSPPKDLPPHELYFSQNRGAGMKTSNNNLSSLALLDHEEFFNLMRSYKDPHEDDMVFLQDLHARSFNQWQFELSQDFNICIYGWGSKRSLLTSFAEHIYKSHTDNDRNKIVVVNGYVHNITPRDILNTLATSTSSHLTKLGAQPTEMLETLSALLEEDPSRHITLIIHSIDAIPIRRAATQTILSRLASHPQISLIASADHPSFPLLWDSSLRSTYNFIFHDCTTFRPYTAEIDVVNDVHDLLGRSGRRVGGKDGVSFVLKSLPQNAKNLFRVLVAEQLAGMEDDGGGFDGGSGDEDQDEEVGRRGPGIRRSEVGVEYRLLYQKAVEDFICGDEVSFRTLLKEYVYSRLIISIYRFTNFYILDSTIIR